MGAPGRGPDGATFPLSADVANLPWMLALATVFIVVVLSLLITRTATVMLTLTCMSREAARFQARSALSGAGYTTTEAEAIVNHPVRRRVVFALMLIGSAGIVTAVATLMLSFTGATPEETTRRILLLSAGLLALLLVARSSWVDRRLSWLLGRIISRWTDLDVRDYAELLHLADDYSVMEIAVREDDWVAGRSRAKARLRDEGVAVLGIETVGGEYIGAPLWSTTIEPGSVLLSYGPRHRLCEIDRRARGPEGDRAHEEAVAEQDERLREVAAQES